MTPNQQLFEKLDKLVDRATCDKMAEVDVYKLLLWYAAVRDHPVGPGFEE